MKNVSSVDCWCDSSSMCVIPLTLCLSPAPRKCAYERPVKSSGRPGTTGLSPHLPRLPGSPSWDFAVRMVVSSIRTRNPRSTHGEYILARHHASVRGGYYSAGRVANGDDFVRGPNSPRPLPIIEPVLSPSFATRVSWSLEACGRELLSLQQCRLGSSMTESYK